MGWELWDCIKLSELWDPAPQTEKDNLSNSEPHPISRTQNSLLLHLFPIRLPHICFNIKMGEISGKSRGSRFYDTRNHWDMFTNIWYKNTLSNYVYLDSSGPKVWPWSHHFQLFEASISSNTYIYLYFQNQKRLAIARTVVNPSRYGQEKGLKFPWISRYAKSRSVPALRLQRVPWHLWAMDSDQNNSAYSQETMRKITH